MEFTQWTEQYSVGDPLMDAYHHVFFQTIEDLTKSVNKLPTDVLGERIEFLMSYARMHFDSEEHLMEAHAYPDIELHKAAHRSFLEEITFIQDSFRSNPTARIAEQLLAMAQYWLSKHILTEDMKYKPYLSRDGSRKALRVQD
jgi:hemerythrin